MPMEKREQSPGDHQIEEGAEQPGDEAGRMVEEARHEAEEQADRWTAGLGRRGEHLARALNAASDTLREEGEERMSGMASEAAEKVKRMGGYLEDEDPSSMMHDLEDLGRSNPAAFLGGVFVAGLLGGRLLRASSPRESRESRGSNERERAELVRQSETPGHVAGEARTGGG